MPSGTPLTTPVAGRIVIGGLGSAYGQLAFRIRTVHRDILLGHVEKVTVREGQLVKPGNIVAYSGNLAASDGAHLHFEVRPIGAGYTAAEDPMLQLRAQIVATR